MDRGRGRREEGSQKSTTNPIFAQLGFWVCGRNKIGGNDMLKNRNKKQEGEVKGDLKKDNAGHFI